MEGALQSWSFHSTKQELKGEMPSAFTPLPPQVFIHSCPTHEDRLFQSYPVWKTYRNIWDAHHVDVLPVRSPTAKKLQLAGSKVKEQQEKKVHVPKDMFCQA